MTAIRLGIVQQKLADRRPLWQAIAHAMLSAKAGDQPRMALLNRLYGALTPEQQLRCRATMLDCREARRSMLMKGVA